MSIYGDLKQSLDEVVEIESGQREPDKVTVFDVADVKAIRTRLGKSQAEFAHALGTSSETIKSWENHRRNPTGLAAKVLNAINDDLSFFHTLAKH